MLEAVDLSLKLSKAEFREVMNGPDGLLNLIRRLQRRCVLGEIPVCVLFEGWDAAGKGTLISKLVERLDPRAFRVQPVSAPLDEERLRPFLWRFWLKLPPTGQWAIFDRSWYGRVLVERVDELVSMKDVRTSLKEILEFERQLTADGMLMFKFFLHISKKEQKKRFEACEKDPFEAWKIQPEDWRHHEQYDEYVLAIEEMLAETSRSNAPWTIVESTNLRWAQCKIFRTLCDTLGPLLDERGIPDPETETVAAQPPEELREELTQWEVPPAVEDQPEASAAPAKKTRSRKKSAQSDDDD